MKRDHLICFSFNLTFVKAHLGNEGLGSTLQLLALPKKLSKQKLNWRIDGAKGEQNKEVNAEDKWLLEERGAEEEPRG